MKFEDRVFMDVRCRVPYVNVKKMKRSGVQTRLTLGQVFDLGHAVEYHADDAGDSCLRNGLMLNTEFTVGSLRENNFTIGNGELIGVCDIVKCKCDKGYDVMADSVKGRSRKCFENLSTGKCVDHFVRSTVGTALFPQFYAQQKQR